MVGDLFLNLDSCHISFRDIQEHHSSSRTHCDRVLPKPDESWALKSIFGLALGEPQHTGIDCGFQTPRRGNDELDFPL